MKFYELPKKFGSYSFNDIQKHQKLNKPKIRGGPNGISK